MWWMLSEYRTRYSCNSSELLADIRELLKHTNRHLFALVFALFLGKIHTHSLI